jgi:hypothetical protein
VVMLRGLAEVVSGLVSWSRGLGAHWSH